MTEPEGRRVHGHLAAELLAAFLVAVTAFVLSSAISGAVSGALAGSVGPSGVSSDGGPWPATAGQETQDRGGRLVEIWTDPFPGGPGPSGLIAPGSAPFAPSVEYFLALDDGRWVPLDLRGWSPSEVRAVRELAGRRVMVRGALSPTAQGAPGLSHLGRSLRVESIRAWDSGDPILGFPAPPRGAFPGQNPSEIVRYATVLCRFPGSPDEGVRSISDYRAWFGDDPPGLGHYWEVVSRGRVDFQGDRVVGWYDLPEPIAYYFEDPQPGERVKPDWGLLAGDCVSQAEPDVDFSEVQGVNLQFNVRFGASWGGVGMLALEGEQRSVGITWMASWAGHSTYAHEIGHTFGLPHSSGPYEATYDSRWDIMSDGNTLWDAQLQTGLGQHTIAFHRDYLGWVSPDRRWVADGFGTTDTLALEFWNQAGGRGWDLIQVPLYDGTFYTVEARKQEGYDAGIPFRSVILHHVDQDRSDRWAQVVDVDWNGDPNDQGAAWTPGEYFQDREEGVHLSVLGEKAGQPGVDEGFVVVLTRGWWLDLAILGEGRVYNSLWDLECTSDCSRLFPHSGTVTLKAEPAEELVFAGWDGACSGAGPCYLHLGGRDEVMAEFSQPLRISSEGQRPPATVGAWYEDLLSATGGSTRRTWEIAEEEALPRGLSLDSLAGVIKGIPEEKGQFRFQVQARSKALLAEKQMELAVGIPEVLGQDAIAEILTRGPTLTLEEERYLDIVGNHNGRFDIGDVYLLIKGESP